MALFEVKKKRGRPRKKFELAESEKIIKSTLGRVKNVEVFWETHKRLSDNVFSINVKYISFYSIEMILKHRNVRDVYFNPFRTDHSKELQYTLKIVYG